MKKALLFSFTIALLSCGPSASDNAVAEQEKLTKKLEEENRQIQKHIDLIELKASKQRKDNKAAIDLLTALGISTKEQLVNYLTSKDGRYIKVVKYTKEQLTVYNLMQLDSIFLFGLNARMDEEMLDEDPPPIPTGQ